MKWPELMFSCCKLWHLKSDRKETETDREKRQKIGLSVLNYANAFKPLAHIIIIFLLCCSVYKHGITNSISSDFFLNELSQAQEKPTIININHFSSAPFFPTKEKAHEEAAKHYIDFVVILLHKQKNNTSLWPALNWPLPFQINIHERDNDRSLKKNIYIYCFVWHIKEDSVHFCAGPCWSGGIIVFVTLPSFSPCSSISASLFIYLP